MVSGCPHHIKALMPPIGSPDTFVAYCNLTLGIRKGYIAKLIGTATWYSIDNLLKICKVHLTKAIIKNRIYVKYILRTEVI